ncbi:MAG: peptide chain release factor N(5)-glutamine methyltransferase [Verrucomicrobia bacterium]|jgi:release factor glutamine methyltransferase|nr:peptide chain release factor N(5)-glutamine methyltransferase [Verrucomicrobiota bacterium]
MPGTHVTVLEVIQKSADFLAKKGVESPRLQIELLLAHVLKMPRMKLYLNFERALSPMELDAVRELVKRRGQREPLQHIVGSTSFCGLEIAVNRHVLVPRPETELLAEAGWQCLSGYEGRPGSPPPAAPPPANVGAHGVTRPTPSALDFGTGSGCIAIALAAKCPASLIVALDASIEALAVAKQNAARCGVTERIRFVQGDGFAALPPGAHFDLIISNPPYIPTAEIASLQPEVRNYDPRAALDGGSDGLVFYRRLAAQAAGFLKPGGKIMVELGDGRADATRAIFETQKWIVEAVKEDYTQRPRIMVARRA